MQAKSQTAVGGPPAATVEQMLPVVYQELRASARRERRRLGGNDTMVTTALINEVYLHLANNHAFSSRGQFLGIAAVAMRNILIDRVRAQLAAKRGGGVKAVELEAIADFAVEDEDTVIGVHDALEGLAAAHPVLVQVVECRFFAGYNDLETAEALGLSERTVQRHWATARAWLKREMRA